GGILGNLIAPGGSNTVGTVLGALAGSAAGAAIGNSADNNNEVVCR
ncbi:MAG TPA: glycine zipper 2TM domain-containing protein, partial [Croceibacterium sp.]